MNKDELVYVRHVLGAIDDIEQITKALDKQTFLSNISARHAVVRCIEIMGEASKHLSNEFRKKHSDIPWSDIAKMRDKAIHDYLGVNYDIVWDVVQKDLPELKRKIKRIIEG